MVARRPKASDLELLRAVYASQLREGRADSNRVAGFLSVPVAYARSALAVATRRGLLNRGAEGFGLTRTGRKKLKVVMIGGAFEIIHPGHIHTISEARKLGNTLVVVVATDESVLKNKGREPVTTQEWRVRLVSSLREVDIALPGNKGSIYDILLRVRPDVVAIGYDQHHDPAEIEKEAARRGLKLVVSRLSTPIPAVKTSKILVSL